MFYLHQSKDDQKPTQAHNHLKGWDERRLSCPAGKSRVEVGPCDKGNIVKDLKLCKLCGPEKTETGSLLNLHGPDPLPADGNRGIVKKVNFSHKQASASLHLIHVCLLFKFD